MRGLPMSEMPPKREFGAVAPLQDFALIRDRQDSVGFRMVPEGLLDKRYPVSVFPIPAGFTPSRGGATQKEQRRG
jgi:hypothetical protein